MSIVKTDVPMTAALCEQTILALTQAYPFCRSELLTQTAFGKPVRTLVIGEGPRRVLYTAAHHANEWITTPVLLKFVEEFAQAMETGGQIGGVDARALAAIGGKTLATRADLLPLMAPALACAAAGLLVAVLSHVMYALLRSRLDHLIADLDAAAGDIRLKMGGKG